MRTINRASVYTSVDRALKLGDFTSECQKLHETVSSFVGKATPMETNSHREKGEGFKKKFSSFTMSVPSFDLNRLKT